MLSRAKNDVMCLTETWHEDSEALPIKRLRSHGLQVRDRFLNHTRALPAGISSTMEDWGAL